ncbi:MAG: hypothetical protein HYV01_22445 [Deltaproteobacteria bacterium]|nr:hypothetical protein [Deltaproteobacteria bacterium]
MKRLLGYVGRYWRRYLVGGFCLLGTATLVMWIPWWIREAVRIIEHGGSLSEVTAYAGIIALAAVAQGVVRTYSRALIFNAGRNVEYDLRNDLFAHLQKLSVSFYHAQRTGDLMSRVINDISAVRVMLGPGILNFVNAPLYYVYALALMLSMDVRMTLATVAPFAVLLFMARKFRGEIMRSSLEVQRQMSVLSSHVQENLSGMHVVKAYAQEDAQISRFAALNEDFQAKSLALARMRGIVNPIMQGVSALTVLIVIWYGGIRVMRGDLLVADIVAFIAYLNVLAWPTAAFGWMLSLVERGRAAMKRLDEILEAPPEITGPPAPLRVRGLKSGVEFRNVSFSYGHSNNGHTALFHVAGGQNRRPGGPDRLGQEQRGPVAAAAVRCVRRRDSARRPGHSPAVAARVAPNDRLRAAGPVFVFDLAAAQFDLRPRLCHRGGSQARRQHRQTRSRLGNFPPGHRDRCW